MASGVGGSKRTLAQARGFVGPLLTDSGSGGVKKGAERSRSRVAMARDCRVTQKVLNQGPKADADDGTIKGVALCVVQIPVREAQCRGITVQIQA